MRFTGKEDLFHAVGRFGRSGRWFPNPSTTFFSPRPSPSHSSLESGRTQSARKKCSAPPGKRPSRSSAIDPNPESIPRSGRTVGRSDRPHTVRTGRKRPTARAKVRRIPRRPHCLVPVSVYSPRSRPTGLGALTFPVLPWGHATRRCLGPAGSLSRPGLRVRDSFPTTLNAASAPPGLRCLGFRRSLERGRSIARQPS
jgi:hypothetical protein